MRTIRGLRSAQRSIIAREWSLEPPSMQICSKPKFSCCRATEASVRSIVADAYRLTVTIESKRSMGSNPSSKSGVFNECYAGLPKNAANEGFANAASCIMLRLHKSSVMHSSNGFHSKFATLFLALMPVTLWLALRGYHGLTEDGQIYAFQAFARLHPQLTADLYLQNTSQDQFTLFSPLYARCIELLGLENAARLLTLSFTLWLLAAAWNFVRAVAHRDAAWLAVAFLVIVAGDYGAAGGV